jgi:opacity protein-like surface antigen
MRRGRLGQWAIMLALGGILGAGPAAAGGFDFSQVNREWGLRLAYGKSTQAADVRLYTLLPRWGLVLVRPGHARLGGVGVSFIVEGIVSIADAEDTGWELGVTPLLKLNLPLGERVLLFIEGGAGLILENFDSPKVAHTFNFTPQVGGGVDIALRRNLALCLAYRFRHSSNAGLYDENPAFNVNLFQVGLTYYR